MTGAVLLVGGPGGRGAYWWGLGVDGLCLMSFISVVGAVAGGLVKAVGACWGGGGGGWGKQELCLCCFCCVREHWGGSEGRKLNICDDGGVGARGLGMWSVEYHCRRCDTAIVRLMAELSAPHCRVMKRIA